MNYSFFKYCILILVFTASSCVRVAPYKTGEEAFDKEQYDLSIQLLKRELQKSSELNDKYDKLILLTKANIKLHRFENAEKYGLQAKSTREKGLAEELLGDINKARGNYEEARMMYKEAGILQGDPFRFRRNIKELEYLKNLSNRPRIFELKETDFSTSSSEYSIEQYKDGYLISTDAFEEDHGTYDQTGRFFHEIAFLNAGSLEPLKGGINTQDNEGVPDVSSDNKSMLFTRCQSKVQVSENKCKVYLSKWNGTEWNEGTMLPFCQEEFNYVHARFGNSENEIYFSSDQEGGRGGYDIYRVSKSNGNWTEPILLSGQINGSSDELFPFLIKDTLFYSSRGLNSFGGLDVFKSIKLGGKSWSQSINMNQPINSGYDDFGFVVLEKEGKRERFVCSSRNGNDDIFSVLKRKEIVEEKPSLDTPIIVLAVKVFTKDPNTGFTYPFKDAQPVLSNKAGVQIRNTKTESNLTEFYLEAGMDYDINMALKDYYSMSSVLSTNDIYLVAGGADIYIEKELILEPIVRNQEIVLSDIYYDFDRWDIRADARPSLDKLAKLLFDNPDINIQLSSHTDCQGDASYNQELSQRRAESARDYLLKLGISSERVSAKGLGENARKTDCKCSKCTQEEYQLDRRTSFTIL